MNPAELSEVMMNMTGSNESFSKMFHTTNSVVSVLLGLILPVPALILSLLIIAALLLAKDIKWKMRVLLLFTVVPDVFFSLAYMANYFGQPFRSFDFSIVGLTSCITYGTLSLIGATISSAAAPLFASAVYIFVKYDMKKLPWKVIILYIIAALLVALALAVAHATVDTISVSEAFRVCVTLSKRTKFVIAVVATFGAVINPLNAGSLIIIGLISHWYVRNNVSSDSPKKAMTEVLLFHAAKSVGLVFEFGITAVFFFDLRGTFGAYGSLFVAYFIVVFHTIVTTTLTPISIMIFLKPIRDALKQLFTAARPSPQTTTAMRNLTRFILATAIEQPEDADADQPTPPQAAANTMEQGTPSLVRDEQPTPPPVTEQTTPPPPPAMATEQTTPPPAEELSSPPATAAERTTPPLAKQTASPPGTPTEEPEEPLADAASKQLTPPLTAAEKQSTPPTTTKRSTPPPAAITAEQMHYFGATNIAAISEHHATES